MARRRSKKKTRSKRKPLGKWLMICGLSLVILLVVGGFGLYLALRSYLHSDRFRGMLEEQVGSAFDAEGEFAPFKWTGTTAYTDWFKAHGYDEAAFARAKADSIKTRVDFGAVRRGVQT